MNYDALFAEQLDGLREAGNYRVFAELERQAGSFPRARRWTEDGEVEEVVDLDTYNALRRSYDAGVAEFLNFEYVKPNTLGNTRMLLDRL